MKSEVWAASVASVAAIASLIALYFAARTARASEKLAKADLERWQAEREARQQATLSLCVDTVEGLSLVLTNEGPAVAEGIELKPLETPKGFLELGMLEGALPLTLLPRQRFNLPVTVAVPHPRHLLIRIHVSWTDGNGTHEHEVPVSFGVPST